MSKVAQYPRFKSYHGKPSCQYPQNCEVVDKGVKVPQIGVIKASIHRLFDGQLKTVTITKTPTQKYYASLLFDTEQETPEVVPRVKVTGVDLGLKDFCITHDGVKTSKYANPRHLKKHEKNLARKQAKLARKKKGAECTAACDLPLNGRSVGGSKSREKARKLLARVHERISNARQDFLHKLSRKIVDDNQVVVVENLNVKGMVRNHNLAKAISDVGWGMFVNFLAYKLEQKGGLLVEIDRWFPSSKTCSNCLHPMSEMPLDVREWTCPSCGTHHDRDENASKNIRAEGIRQLSVLGTRTAAEGGEVRPKGGRKSILRHSPVNSEAPTIPIG